MSISILGLFAIPALNDDHFFNKFIVGFLDSVGAISLLYLICCLIHLMIEYNSVMKMMQHLNICIKKLLRVEIDGS